MSNHYYTRKLVQLGLTLICGKALAAPCDVLISGGSLSALTAALSSAREGVATCLVEPTNWAGGQITASGVPALDFAWHKIGDVSMSLLTRTPENMEENLRSWTKDLGNPGGCWVSYHCFEPKTFLNTKINPAIAKEPKLTVFYNTVVKSLEKEGARIVGVKLIQRLNSLTQKTPTLSETIGDWYDLSTELSPKKEIVLSGADAPKIFIDASENGDLLALSSEAYTQGGEEGVESADSTCGQATVFPFVMDGKASASEPVVTPEHPEFYSLGRFTWDKIWTYRRLKGSGDVFLPGQKSLQNWNPGNDYPYGYLWVSQRETNESRADWRGGYNVETIKAAERHALGWYQWYKAKAPLDRQKSISLDLDAMGTLNGLSKFPYVRDTRRSIGLDNFRLTVKDILGSKTRGTKFLDRVAIHTYAMDIHPLKGKSCYSNENQLPPPYYIPFRSLTNRDVKNLLVAGKTMAQTFMVNSSSRVHAGEMASGTASGMAASYMIKKNLDDTRDVLRDIVNFRAYSAKRTPSDWTGY
ncbi:MAG: FAD-dependent oxidoreductase [Pseudomonadota bacterium]